MSCDHLFLSKSHDVILYQHKSHKRFIPYASEFIKIFIYLITNIRRIHLCYCWFSDFHSFLPTLFARLFRKKSILIVGGYDAVSLPEIDYGLFYKNAWRRLLGTVSFKNANQIIAVDSSLIRSINSYVDERGLQVGVAHFVKNIENKCHTVPTGYDYNKWKRLAGIKKEKIVLSIGAVYDKRNFQRKGFDLLIEIAKEMPHVRFTIIGLMDEAFEHARQISSSNVAVLGYVPNDDLINYYSCSKVFCQLSLTEGLPNTLCEAMLCECVPVGSNVNGIPKAIGTCGFILKKRDKSEAKKLIKQAFEADEKMGKLARTRIIEKFRLELRSNAILNLIDKL